LLFWLIRFSYFRLIADIPETVVLGTEGKVARRKLNEWQEQQRLYEEFDPEYSGMDWRQWYLLEDPDWRYDTIPEFMDGENVADWMDAELEERLAELLAEEIERERQLGDMEIDADYTSELTGDQLQRLQRIREMRQLIINEHRLKKIKNGSVLPKHKMSSVGTVGEFEDQLAAMGIDAEAALKSLREDAHERSRSRSRSQSQARGRKRSREEMEEDRRLSKTPKPGEGFKDLNQKLKAEKLARNALKLINRAGRQGESDRRIPDEMPKHLYSGKRGMGKTDRR
jgi:nucleolar GTP-binding protein